MKFRKITITNFMRYKGENQLEFSCDPEKNVTVVLGNNTFGKTTIAQAFRWGLYGEIINTRYVKSKDVNLLNNEILGEMDANDRKDVSVEIEVEDGNYVYLFLRKATFVRKFPQFVAEQRQEKLYMRIRENEKWSEFIDNAGNSKGKNSGVVEERIKLMFPQELSSYFFFDGERWSDEKNTKNDIKNSISTIMGISPLVQMKYHLNEYGQYGKLAVIKRLQAKMVGSDSKVDDLKRELEKCYNEIDFCIKKIEKSKEAAKQYREKIDKSESILNGNKKVEDDQKEAKKLESSIDTGLKHMEVYYSDIVKQFSKAHTYFAAPLLEQVVKLLSNVDLDGKDIPDITTDTIDYLILEKRCLCGHEILENSLEHKNLLQLKKVIPPEVIGSIVAKFQDRLTEWENESQELYSNIIEKADVFEGEKATVDENEEELERVNKRIDNKINFAIERNKMQANKNNEREALEQIRKSELNIKHYKDNIDSINKQLNELISNTDENQKYSRMIAYAEHIYKSASDILKSKEAPLVKELNNIIRENYAKMFKEKEKYAQLGEDYKLHLFYNKVSDFNGYRDLEEHALSEGELIARNFVFIVSILELAKRKQKEEVESGEESVVLNLPLVLDGPFSKLSSDNTALISKVLPMAAEQVIIFMLDKDWEAAGLDAYTCTKYKYRVSKEVDGNSASIESYKGGM